MTHSQSRNQFPHILDFPSATQGQHSSSVPRREEGYTNSGMQSSQVNICVFICLFMKTAGRDGGQKHNASKTWLFFMENWKRRVFRKLPSNTNKWVSQRRENILKLTDVSSLCICYYLHCQRSLLRLSHCLATVILVTIALISLLCELLLYGQKRQSCGFCLSLWWISNEAESLLPSLPPSLLLPGADREGTAHPSFSSCLVSHLTQRLVLCLQRQRLVFFYLPFFSLSGWI